MPRPKLYDDDLRRRLISRAAAMLADGGPDALALRPLAVAEGTSTSAVYAMFGDKAALVGAVCAEAASSFAAAQAAVPVTADPVRDLAGLGRAYRDWALANPALYQVMFALPGPPPEPGEGPAADPPMSDPTIAPLRSAVDRLIAAGRVVTARSAGVTRARLADTMTLSVWAGVHGLVALELAGRLVPAGVDPQDLFAAQLRSIVRGWLREPG